MERVFKIVSLVLAMALAPAALLAEGVTARVVQVKGKPSVVLASGSMVPLTMGQEVQSGDRVVTTATSTVTLLLADGSELAVGVNTDMTLTEHSRDGAHHTTLFSVFQGLIKATVKKLTVGSKFELSSSHGVAAVKGTEYEARVHPDKGMEVRVNEGRVWLHDLKREKKVVVDKHRAAHVIKNRLGKLRKLRNSEIRHFRRWVRESVPRDAERAAKAARFWHSLKPGQKRRFVNAARESLGETWDDITQLRSEERQAKWQQKLRHADDLKLAGDESRVDFALGNVLIDRHGRRVRMQEFILRPRPDTIQFLNYTKREGRTDLVTAKHIYNKDLPRHLGNPALRLGKNTWYWTAPQYWVVEGSVVFANATSGDNISHVVTFYDPVKLNLITWALPVRTADLRLNIPDISNPAAGGGVLLERYERTLVTLRNPLTGDVVSWGASYIGDGTYETASINTAGVTRHSLVGGATDAVNSDLKYAASDVGGPVLNRPLTLDELGGRIGDISGGFLRKYADGTELRLASYAIDETGRVRNALDLLSDGNLFEAFIQLAFFTFNEVEFNSTRFSGGMEGPGIDVVSKMMWWSIATKTKDRL